MKRLCPLLASVVVLLTCKPVEQPQRVVLGAQARERLMQQMKESREFDARLRDLQGAPSADVLRTIGKPARSSPCGVNCFYYDVGRETQFICFDDHDRAVCHGHLTKTTGGRYR